jgi:hypothetical protein
MNAQEQKDIVDGVVEKIGESLGKLLFVVILIGAYTFAVCTFASIHGRSEYREEIEAEKAQDNVRQSQRDIADLKNEVTNNRQQQSH